MRAVAHLKAILISVHWDEGTSFQLYEIRDFDFGSVIVGYRSVSGNQPVPKCSLITFGKNRIPIRHYSIYLTHQTRHFEPWQGVKLIETIDSGEILLLLIWWQYSYLPFLSSGYREGVCSTGPTAR